MISTKALSWKKVILLELSLLLRLVLTLGILVRPPLLLGKLTGCTNRDLTLANHIWVLDRQVP